MNPSLNQIHSFVRIDFECLTDSQVFDDIEPSFRLLHFSNPRVNHPELLSQPTHGQPRFPSLLCFSCRICRLSGGACHLCAPDGELGFYYVTKTYRRRLELAGGYPEPVEGLASLPEIALTNGWLAQSEDFTYPDISSNAYAFPEISPYNAYTGIVCDIGIWG